MRKTIRYCHDNIVLATAISPDGRLAATGGGNNQEIHLWTLHDGELQKRFRGSDYLGGNLYLIAIGVSDYQNDTLDLRYAAADAHALHNALIAQQGKAYH